MPARRVTEHGAMRLTITLDAADREELDRLARENGRSVAWYVREALRQYLDRTDDAPREPR